MDPRSKAEFELEMAKFRKAIGQERPEDSLYQRLRSFYGVGGALSVAPAPQLNVHGSVVPNSYHWAQQIPHITPAGARAILGMQSAAYMAWTEPSRWDRLKGTFFVRLRDFRRWLGSKIAGCECDTTW